MRLSEEARRQRELELAGEHFVTKKLSWRTKLIGAGVLTSVLGVGVAAYALQTRLEEARDEAYLAGVADRSEQLVAREALEAVPAQMAILGKGAETGLHCETDAKSALRFCFVPVLGTGVVHDTSDKGKHELTIWVEAQDAAGNRVQLHDAADKLGNRCDDMQDALSTAGSLVYQAQRPQSQRSVYTDEFIIKDAQGSAPNKVMEC